MITELKKIAKQAFPDYKGRKYAINQKGSLTLYNTNWGGGSRNYYTAYNYENGKFAPLANYSPWFNPAEGSTVVIPPFCCVIEHSIFCGHDCGITIYLSKTEEQKLIA